MRAWALALVVACSGGAPADRTASDDAHRYARMVASPDPDPTTALADCASLSDPDLAGDCGLAVALGARARGTGALTDLCPLVVDGAWRDECAFMLAEDLLRARDLDGAAAACMRSGAFKDDCGQHLWQGDLRKLVRGTRALPLPERVAVARKLYDRWQPRLPDTDIAWRFWQRLFERVAEHQPGVKLDRCDALDDAALAVRCRHGAAHLYLRRVWDHLHRPDSRATFCTLPPGDVAAAEATFPPLQAQPHPLLQAVLEEAHAAGCQSDRLRPPEGGALSRDALEAELAALPSE